jgi:hypothetical protein
MRLAFSFVSALPQHQLLDPFEVIEEGGKVCPTLEVARSEL